MDTNIEISNECIACNNNDLPTGAHTCIACGKNVHILPGCSFSLNESEGYGEKRICKSCMVSKKRKSISLDGKMATSTKIVKSQQSIEMNYEEQWGKKKRVKSSRYLQPDPMWSVRMKYK